MTATQRATDFSHVPLTRKLGIGPGALVLVVGSSASLAATLEPLPEGARIVTRPPRATDVDVAVLFCTRQAELKRRLDGVAARLAPAGGLWVAWPKRTSRLATDLDFEAVQGAGLALGLVDNKSCSIDDEHSGLRFVVRREQRADWPRTRGDRR